MGMSTFQRCPLLDVLSIRSSSSKVTPGSQPAFRAGKEILRGAVADDQPVVGVEQHQARRDALDRLVKSAILRRRAFLGLEQVRGVADDPVIPAECLGRVV